MMIKIKSIICGLVFCSFLASCLFANAFPVAGEWRLTSETKSYLILISDTGAVSFWKELSQQWCEYGRAMIYQEVEPVYEERNMMLIIKVGKDVFKFPYNHGQRAFTGICIVSHNIDIGGSVIKSTQAQKCSMWKEEDAE